MKVFVISWPPWAWKSTIINFLQKKWYLAFDIEKMWNSYEERKEKFEHFFEILKNQYNDKNVNVFFWIADFWKRDFDLHTETKFILLLPDFDIYYKRVKKRNEKFPKKRWQNEIKNYQSHTQKMKDNYYDLYIKNNFSIDKTMKILLNYCISNG